MVLSREMREHPVVGNTAKLCSILFPTLGIIPETSPLYPVLGNPIFQPGCEGKDFRFLRDTGCIYASSVRSPVARRQVHPLGSGMHHRVVNPIADFC